MGRKDFKVHDMNAPSTSRSAWSGETIHTTHVPYTFIDWRKGVTSITIVCFRPYSWKGACEIQVFARTSRSVLDFALGHRQLFFACGPFFGTRKCAPLFRLLCLLHSGFASAVAHVARVKRARSMLCVPPVAHLP
eukprot:scaffold2857_cov344-Pavlova_lutheri.AAC.30